MEAGCRSWSPAEAGPPAWTRSAAQGLRTLGQGGAVMEDMVGIQL